MTPQILIVHKNADWLAGELGRACPGPSFTTAPDAAAAMDRAAEAEVLIGLAPFLPPTLIATMPRLKWIHAMTTGVDNLLADPGIRPEIAISNSRGFHGPQMSELAILLMLSLNRRFPTVLHNQDAAIWSNWPQPLLDAKTACIVGLGAIAESLAVKCRAFGMRLTGVSDGRSEMDGFDRIYRRADLPAAAAEADFLVVIVPYAPETRHLIDDRVLQAMKPSAFVINIARGGCVDEAALLRHLRAGTIAGAGLDVFSTEPLPADSPFWAAPNVIVTPHIGGLSETYAHQVLPVIERNLRAYLDGGAAALPDLVRRS